MIMNRRTFQQKLALSIPLLIAPSFPEMPKRIFPTPLRKGDTIGLITPGSYISDEGLEKAMNNIQSLGFKVKVGKHIRASRGFNAGTDEERLNDLHAMFADDSVAAIWCARGGYGCSRLLPHINYKMISKHPKVLIGYSDVTALLNAIYEKTGLIGLHGPVGASELTNYTQSELLALASGNTRNYEIKISPSNLNEEAAVYHPRTIRSGVAEGILVGGNLSLLAAMAGTEYLPDFKNKIVFIEDIGEKPYRVDRMLTQLRQAAKLKEAAGILLGVFADCEADEDERSLTLWETVNDRTKDLGIPVLYGFSFGHISNQCTLPVGIKVRMDVEQQSLVILEEIMK